MDIKTKAKQLAEALVNSPEYQRLKEALDGIEKHQAARIMLNDFHKKQISLQRQQLEGKPVTESQANDLSKLYEVLNINPYIRELFESELEFHKIMMDVQEILGEAIDLAPLYEMAEDEEDLHAEEDAIEAARNKLWTPGN